MLVENLDETPHSGNEAEAQRLGELGIAVIPTWEVLGDGTCACPKGRNCGSPGKHPRTTNGYKDATKDPQVIELQYRRAPHAGVAIVTGRKSNLVTLDIDPRNGGDESLEALIQQYGPLPDTVEVLTGGGGRHFYFAYPANGAAPTKAKTILGDGAELLADGAYAVAPKTRHASGRNYRYRDGHGHGEIAVAPWPESWPVEAPPKTARIPARADIRRPGKVTEGNRNSWLISLGGAMRRVGAEEAVIREALQAANRIQLHPQMEVDEVERVSASAAKYEPNEADAKDSQSGTLVKLTDGMPLIVDQHGRPYVRLKVEGHRELWPVGSGRLKHWLAHQFYQQKGKPPSASGLADAINVITGRAMFDGEPHTLGNRFAQTSDAVWYDMADEEWRVLRITAADWRLVDNPPPLFRRYSHQRPQVEPEGGGDLLELLRPLVNVQAEADLLLVAVSLPLMLLADIPRAVLILFGPQGSAKSLLTRMLRCAVDPSAVPMPRFPRGEDELAQVLDHHAVVALDNLSTISESMSDALCRAVTGAGDEKRKLYTDDDAFLREYKRTVILNGINVPAQRPDLLDRSVPVRLEMIPEKDRREEKVVWAEFESRRPQIFGAMLDALSGAMRRVSDIRVEPLPRMADWTRWGAAVTEAMGRDPKEFVTAYARNRQDQNTEALGSHPIGAAVAAFMEGRQEWKGRPGELLEKLCKTAQTESIDTKQKEWPKSANWLARRLGEVETNLLLSGIRYERQKAGERSIRLHRVVGPPEELRDVVEALGLKPPGGDWSPFHEATA